MGAAGSMPHGSPHCTGSSPSNPDPSAVEPICPDPIAFLPPYVSDIRLAQPFSASSSTTPGRIPSLKELQEELEGQARMATKVQEAENKRASKARIREGERGQWWPCENTDMELRELQNEGMISAYWSFIRDTDVPKPGADEVVMTKAGWSADCRSPVQSFSSPSSAHMGSSRTTSAQTHTSSSPTLLHFAKGISESDRMSSYGSSSSE